MTTYIPALTLPASVFSTPATAILLPITLGAGIGYAIRPKPTQKTYMSLKQPPLRPPPWLFGPVWTILYGLMGYASYRAWHAGSVSLSPATRELAKQGATLYTIQLGLNLAWMPLFFGIKRPAASAVDIVALTGTLSYLTYIWSQVDTTAAWLMAPYLAWVSFATYLNIGTGYLNDWDISDKEKPMPPRGPASKDKFVNEK